MRRITMLIIASLFLVGGTGLFADSSAPIEDIPYEKLPRLGSADAPVKLVEFADFKCPHCATFATEVFPPIKSEYIDSGKAAVYFMHFPVVAADSVTAGAAGAAVHEIAGNDAFWEFYETLFRRQGPPGRNWATPDYLSALAASAVEGLNADALRAGLREGRYVPVVRRDFDIANRLGVNGTPTLFVNDKKVENPQSVEAIRTAIEKEL